MNTKYPTLSKAIELIALSNGCININCTAAQIDAVVFQRFEEEMIAPLLSFAEYELSSMTFAQLNDLCSGDSGGEQTCSATVDKVLALATEVMQ